MNLFSSNASVLLFWIIILIIVLTLILFATDETVDDLKRYVDPAAIVVTGDLTDAKTADYSGSRQYREEWEEYLNIVESVNKTGSSGPVWLDIRGNHDNFDVPHHQHR